MNSRAVTPAISISTADLRGLDFAKAARAFLYNRARLRGLNYNIQSAVKYLCDKLDYENVRFVRLGIDVLEAFSRLFSHYTSSFFYRD